jgi:cytidylate kinase
MQKLSGNRGTVAVAIDGPAGAGKSTIARRAAEALGFLYVDTGALYRAIGLFVLENGADPSAPQEVCPLLKRLSVTLGHENGEQKVFLNGADVGDKIRSPEVSMAASKVSAIPEVRRFLLGLQREIAEKNNVVMDGRDIGTVVLPQAQVKIFLTASPEDRARRRYEEMLQKGQQADYGAVLSDLKQRDYNDEHRAVAPLKPADGAVLVNTTGNTLAQSVSILTEIIKTRLAGKY